MKFNTNFSIELPKELLKVEVEEAKKFFGLRKFVCELHGEVEVRPITKFLSKMIFSGCPKCIEMKKTQERIEKEEKKRKEAREAFKEKMKILQWRGVSKRYIEDRIRGRIRFDTPFFKKNKKFLEVKGDDFKEKKNLLMLNSCGIGKSYFAYKMVEIAYDLGLHYMIVKADKLKSIYRGEYNSCSPENIEDFLKMADCVIIDEVDNIIDDLTSFNHAVSYLYDECKRICVIGNCNAEVIKRALPAKIYDRLRGSSALGGSYGSMRG